MSGFAFFVSVTSLPEMVFFRISGHDERKLDELPEDVGRSALWEASDEEVGQAAQVSTPPHDVMFL